jgi:hypothetical protein
MRAAVITVGSKWESLGSLKLANWLRRQGWDVEQLSAITELFCDFDLCAFSAVFSWRLPELVRMVKIAQLNRCEIWIGGPAVTFHRDNFDYVVKETGVTPTTGIDERFEREPGKYPMVYFSRGCPAYGPGCGPCPVPRIEGNRFRYYPNAEPAPLLLDNNLSALPGEYQDHIIARYEGWNGRVDANSGFEPHTFNGETLTRWQQFPLRYWRFGYDDLTERDVALEMLERLRFAGINSRRIRVYTLIGNEPIDDCIRRINEVIERGGEPVPQRMRPLNWRCGPLPTKHDWTEPLLIACQRFYMAPQLWKSMSAHDFYYQGHYPLSNL